MSQQPTNYDLGVMLARIEERQINVVDDIKKSREWQEAHEKKDEERFTNLNKYAASLAIVAGAIGAGGTWLLKKMGVV